MKKFFWRKPLGLILSVALFNTIFQTNSLLSYAEETENVLAETEEAEEDVGYELTTLPREEIEFPSASTKKASTYSLRRSGDLRYYNAAEEGYVTSVKNQRPYGNCWAFSALGTVESNLLKNGYGNQDLSEWHTSYYTYHTVVDPLGLTEGDSTTTNSSYESTYLKVGGDERAAILGMINWMGPVDESYAKYSNISNAGSKLADTVESAYEHDAFHVQGMYVTPTALSDRDSIKSMILKYGAVGASYYYNSTYCQYVYDEDGKVTSANTYCPTREATNHAITVVGWDDDYAADNFKTTPSEDGAWIVKNSWGTSGTYTVNGYFYISYCDLSMNNQYNTAMAVEVEASDNYDNNYFYDGTTALGIYDTVSDGGSIANVFVSQSDESLEAVGVGFFSANVEYSVQIYTGLELTDGIVKDPTAGTAMLEEPVTGETTYSGIYTIPLDEPVLLPEGEVYSVVVTMEGSSSIKFYVSYSYSGTYFTHTEHTEEGQSFKQNTTTTSWKDLSQSYNKSVARIHAYTNDTSIGKVSVMFNMNGMSETEEYLSLQAKIGTIIEEPEVPLAAGYAFTGWYKDEECTQAWDFTSDTVTTDTILYAGWILDASASFLVTFDTRWSVEAPATQTVINGGKIEEPVLGNSVIYTFQGWYKDADFTIPWDFENDVVTADMTLYLKWKLIPYTVTFDTNGHGTAPDPITNIRYGRTIAKPTDPVCEGYQFIGWYQDKACKSSWNFAANTVTKDITLYAKWMSASCTVTYHTMEETTIETVPYGSVLEEPELEAIEGYVFDGWYQDSNYTQTWDFENDIVTSDIELYALWLEASNIGSQQGYQVNFDTRGSVSAPSAQVVLSGRKVSEPALGISVIFTFDGWYQDASCTEPWDFDKDVVTENMTLYLKWKLIPYTVTFDTRGKGTAPEPITNIRYGRMISKPADPVCEGYQFIGWYQDTAYRSVWNFTANTVTKDITLYAKWQAASCTVTYHNQDTQTTLTVPYGSLLEEPEQEGIAGSQFEGWYKDSNYTQIWDFDNDRVTCDMDLYALWEEEHVGEAVPEYTVKFDSRWSVETPSEQIVKEGRKVAEPSLGQSVIFTFYGWFKDTAYTEQWNFDEDVVTEDMTLYLKWKLIPYTVEFDVNGHGNAPDAITNIRYGRTISEPVKPECDGYEFIGWYQEKACKNKWDFSRNTVTKNITLYAKWQESVKSCEEENTVIAFSEETEEDWEEGTAVVDEADLKEAQNEGDLSDMKSKEDSTDVQQEEDTTDVQQEEDTTDVQQEDTIDVQREEDSTDTQEEDMADEQEYDAEDAPDKNEES